MGRPTLLTPELMQEVCDRISEGRGLREVATDEDMPSFRSLCRYIANDAAFAAMVERSRENAAFVALEELKPISDEGCADNAAVGRARNRIEARTRLAEKLHPRRFSPRVAPSAPEQAVPATDTDPLEVAKGVAFLLAQSGLTLPPLQPPAGSPADPFELAKGLAFLLQGDEPFVPPFELNPKPH